MELDYTAVGIATIIQFIIGGMWYSPFIFGKWWMQIMKVDNGSMTLFYGLQIILTIVSTSFLSIFIKLIPDHSPYLIALYILFGFYIPTQISAVIWANTEKRFWLRQIFIMASYQFIAIILATYILTF